MKDQSKRREKGQKKKFDDCVRGNNFAAAQVSILPDKNIFIPNNFYGRKILDW